MSRAKKAQLATIVKKLAKYRPEGVILFGSYAWGKPTKSSDIDLFVIKKSRRPKLKRMLDVENLLYPSPLPIDVLVYTPSEVKRRLALGDFFIKRIINEGKVLYGKRPA